MLSNNSTESTSIELNRMLVSLIETHSHFEDCIHNVPRFVIDGYELPLTKKIDSLITILINNMILELYKFSEIHGKLHFVEETTFQNSELLKSLKNLKKLILSEEPKITKWRNEIVAHSRGQGMSYEPIYFKDPDYVNSIKKFIFQSRMLIHYILIFFHELPSESTNTSQTVQAMNQKIDEIHLKEWWPELLKKEKEILANTNEELRKNGFSKLPIDNAQKLLTDVFENI